jgi:hypothetical protein
MNIKQDREVDRIADKISKALDGENMCLASEALDRVYALAFATHCVAHGGDVVRTLEQELPSLAAKIKEIADELMSGGITSPPLEAERLH